MFYIYLDSILPFCFVFICPQYRNWLLEEWEKSVSAHIQLRVFASVLCISEWCKNQSLVFEEKAIFLGKQGGLKDYVCSEERFSQLVCFILSRLTFMWALYTLKWTLVALVLKGHYLTYESLRHNQLYFTFKDHLSDGHLSLWPGPSLHTFQG